MRLMVHRDLVFLGHKDAFRGFVGAQCAIRFGGIVFADLLQIPFVATEVRAVIEPDVIPLIDTALRRIGERVENCATLSSPRMVLSDENGSATGREMWNIFWNLHEVRFLFAIAFSSRSSQCKHLVAQGTAASRVTGIGSPQLAHRPHCPVSMRREASVTALSRVASES